MRRALTVIFAALALGFAATWCTACSDDEAPARAYRQDLAELLTDASGFITRLVLDDGDTLALINAGSRGPLVPDTAYRVAALYELHPAGAELLSYSAVFSPRPVVLTGNLPECDPLSLDALWRGGRYVNFLISFRAGGETHSVAFGDAGITDRPDGSRLLNLELYHSRGTDPAYYKQQVYLSCPLAGYADLLTPGRDSVAVSVLTDEGRVERRLPF